MTKVAKLVINARCHRKVPSDADFQLPSMSAVPTLEHKNIIYLVGAE